MRIHLLGTDLDLTPSLKTYAEEKFGHIEKLIQRFEGEGEVELKVDLGRSTQHHHKGLVFYVDANLNLPGTLLRAEEEGEDIRGVIDVVEEKLKREIEKYRTQHEVKRGNREK